MSNIGENSSRSERHVGQAPIAPEPRPLVLRPHETVINPEQRAAAQIGAGTGSENSNNPSSSIVSQQPHSTLVHTLFPPVETVGDAVPARVDGVTLGDYRVLQRIRAGGMGSVFRALDERLNRIVALKVLPPGPARDPGTVLRFQHEAQSAAQLDHDNVARVYTSGQHQGLHYIAFEFIPGSNLRDQIVQFGRVPVVNAVSYTLQIATALLHTSAHAIVHRDIKPSNIIITPEGRAKLVDLGLAKKLTRDDGDVELTSAGTTLGTFDYISPEQARDPRQADIRSDIYSLGCTLYHMLTGAPPFPDGTMLQKLLQHQGDEAPDPRSVNRNVPEQLALIVRRMMAKDPRKRYQTPEQLVRELLTVARQIGLHSATPEGVVWVAEKSRLAQIWEQHAAWMVTSAVLLAIVAGIEFRSYVWPAARAVSNGDFNTSPILAAGKSPLPGLGDPSVNPPNRQAPVPPGTDRTIASRQRPDPSGVDRGSSERPGVPNANPRSIANQPAAGSAVTTDGSIGPAGDAAGDSKQPAIADNKSIEKLLASAQPELERGNSRKNQNPPADLRSNEAPERTGETKTPTPRDGEKRSTSGETASKNGTPIAGKDDRPTSSKTSEANKSAVGSDDKPLTTSAFGDAIRQGIEIAANVARISPMNDANLKSDADSADANPALSGNSSSTHTGKTATSIPQSNGTPSAENRPENSTVDPEGTQSRVPSASDSAALPINSEAGPRSIVPSPAAVSREDSNNGGKLSTATEAVPAITGISPMPQLPANTDTETDANGTRATSPGETTGSPQSVDPGRNTASLATSEFLILGADGKPREGFQSLAAACSRATDGNVIELRFNGRRSERPIRIANTRLTLRAASGYRPEIDFEPDRAVGDDLLRGMLTIAGGNVSITGINMRATISGAALTEGWSLLLLRQPEFVQLRDLVLTVKSPTGSAVTAIAIRPSVGGMTTDMEINTGLPRIPGQLEISGVMFRSDGGIINLRDIDSFRMSFNQSLLLANSTAFLCSGLTQSGGIGNRIDLRMDRVTAVSQRTFFSTEISEANRSLPKLQVSASDCLFVTGGSSKEPFVSLSSAAAASEIRESLAWAGQRNLYEGTRVFRTLLSRSGAFAQESLDFAGWKRVYPGDAEPRNGILNWPMRPRWSELSMSDWTPELLQYRAGSEPPVGADSSALRALFSVPEKSAN